VRKFAAEHAEQCPAGSRQQAGNNKFTLPAWQELNAPFRGCPTTLLTPAFVILSEAKNLMDSGTYNSEILRLTPQNDVVGQALYAHISKFWTL